MRILPILIVICMVVLVVKLNDIFSTHTPDDTHFWMTTTHAAEKAAKDPEAPVTKDEKTSPNGEKKAEEGEQKPSEKSPDNTDEEPKIEYSQVELDLLKSLSERRKKLQEWEENLKNQEQVLTITENRLETKLNELKTLRTEVSGLLGEYNQKEDTKIRSLVKIYESMKAKDAAKIFEDLDMSILLIVADRMKEAKAAPVLAQMSPARARELTMELAKQRKLSPLNPEKNDVLQN